MTEPQSFSTDDDLSERPSAATRDSIRAVIAADLAPVRSRSLGGRALLVGVAALGAAVLVAPSPPVPGLKPAYGRAILAGVMAVLAATASIVASFAPIGGRRLGARSKLLLAAVLLAGWLTYVVSIAHGATAAGVVEATAIGCGARSLVAGLLLGAAAFRVFRHADPWAPRQSGALIGMAAGCVSAAGVGVGCASCDLGHLLVGHALGLPVLALIGALAARRRLQP
jgi:hypothetical protein